MSSDLKMSPELVEMELEEYRTQFESGDKNALIRAIRSCGREQVVMPDWLVNAFFQATNRWYSLEVKTLDEAFGLEWPKGKRFDAARNKRKYSLAAHYRVKELHSMGKAIDEQLFIEVADELGIGKTKVSEYYYAWKNILENMLTP